MSELTNLEEIMTYKCLAFKHRTSAQLGQLIDSVADDESSKLQVKNVCAKLSIELVERLDNTCRLIDMSKREFIEIAIVEALDTFDKLAGDFDIFAPYEVNQEKK